MERSSFISKEAEDVYTKVLTHTKYLGMVGWRERESFKRWCKMES